MQDRIYYQYYFSDQPWAAINTAQRIAKTGIPCSQCAFNYNGKCCPPWTPEQMVGLEIDPHFEGVYRYLTGVNGPALEAFERDRGEYHYKYGPYYDCPSSDMESRND